MRNILLALLASVLVISCADKVVTETSYTNNFTVPIRSNGTFPDSLAIDSVHATITIMDGKNVVYTLDTAVYGRFVSDGDIILSNIPCSETAYIDYSYQVYSGGFVILALTKTILSNAAGDAILPPDAIADAPKIAELVEKQSKAETYLVLQAETGFERCISKFYPVVVEATGTKILNITFQPTSDTSCTFLEWTIQLQNGGSASFVNSTTLIENQIKVNGAVGFINATFVKPILSSSSVELAASSTEVTSSASSSNSVVIPKLVIAIPASPRGTLDKSGSYALDKTLDIKASPNMGYTVRSWTVSPQTASISIIADNLTPNLWHITPINSNVGITLTPVWGTTFEVVVPSGVPIPSTLGTSWANIALYPGKTLDFDLSTIPIDSVFSSWKIEHVGVPLTNLDTSSKLGHIAITQPSGYTKITPAFLPLWNQMNFIQDAVAGSPMRIFKSAGNTLVVIYHANGGLYFTKLSLAGAVVSVPTLIDSVATGSASKGIAIAAEIIDNKVYVAHMDSSDSNTNRFSILSLELSKGTIEKLYMNKPAPTSGTALATGLTAMSARPSTDSSGLVFYMGGPSDLLSGFSFFWIVTPNLDMVSNVIETSLKEIHSISYDQAYSIVAGSTDGKQTSMIFSLTNPKLGTSGTGTAMGNFTSVIPSTTNDYFLLAGNSDAAFIGKQADIPILDIYAPGALLGDTFLGILNLGTHSTEGDTAIAYGVTADNHALVSAYFPEIMNGGILLDNPAIPGKIVSMVQIDHERFATLIENQGVVHVRIMRRDGRMSMQ